MTAPDRSRIHVTIHLMQQAVVSFDSGQVWPRQSVATGDDLASFAEDLTRRLRTDGYIGYLAGPDAITVIPVGSVRRVDFTSAPT